TLDTNPQSVRGTSKSVILVPLFDFKFLNGRAASDKRIGTSSHLLVRLGERPLRRQAHLAAMTYIMIGENARHHCLGDRHGADADAGVVAPLGDAFGFAAVAVDGQTRGENRR